MKKSRQHQSGQGLIEYLILVCLIAVSAISIVSVVGLNIKEQYHNISGSLHGKQSGQATTEAKKDDYDRRGLDDYHKVRSRQQ